MYTIYLRANQELFDFCDFIFMRDFLLIEIYEVLGVRIKAYVMVKKGAISFLFWVRGRCYVWLEMLHKIYYKSYIQFICERFEKLLIFSIDFICICDFWWIEVYEVLYLRSKGTCHGKRRCGIVCVWSSRLMFILNCMLRHIVSHIYHLYASQTKSWWVFSLIWDCVMCKAMG